MKIIEILFCFLFERLEKIKRDGERERERARNRCYFVCVVVLIVCVRCVRVCRAFFSFSEVRFFSREGTLVRVQSAEVWALDTV